MMAAARQSPIKDRNSIFDMDIKVAVAYRKSIELDNPMSTAVRHPQPSLQDTAHSQSKQIETPACSSDVTQGMASNPTATTTQTPVQLQPITRNTETVTGVHNDRGVVNQNYHNSQHYIGGQHMLTKSNRKTKSRKTITDGPPAKKRRGRNQPPVTEKENTAVADNAKQTASTSQSANSVKKVLPQSSSGKKKTKSRGKTKVSSKESKLEEFEEYAENGPSARLLLKSLQPHVIMGNVEKLMYKNKSMEATAELKRFFEQLRFQSHPKSENFKDCAELVTEKKNPLRKALFLAAYACKGARENSNNKRKTFDLAGEIYEIYKTLVKPLSEQEDDYALVLDSSLLSNGAHAIDMALGISHIMREIYEWGFKDTSDAGNSKTYSLRWILVGYHKTKQYTEAITFALDEAVDYDGLESESIVGIHRTLGLCFRENADFDKALAELKKAKSMAEKIISNWNKKIVKKAESPQTSQNQRANTEGSIIRLKENMPHLKREIDGVGKSLKRRRKGQKSDHNACVRT